ncbi:MAG: type IV toxin-antitoxin system AbiEi family antitoxin domain-containing protein [Actinomycetota bacterium]
MDLELRLQSFVATRHGIITRAEAAELGYSTSAIDRRIEQGLWIPVFRRIYRVASVPRCYEQDVPAATIAANGSGRHENCSSTARAARLGRQVGGNNQRHHSAVALGQVHLSPH